MTTDNDGWYTPRPYTIEDQYRTTTAANSTSKQWIQSDMLDTAYEHLRTNQESGLSVQKLRVSDRSHLQHKYTLKCATHSTYAPYAASNIEYIHHIAKTIGRGTHPHFCDSCATPNTDKDATPTSSNPPVNYA